MSAHTRRLSWLIAVLFVAGTCGLGLAARSRAKAQAESQAAVDDYETIIAQIDRWRTLKDSREVVDERPRPGDQLVEPFRGQLHAAGIKPESLVQVTLPDPQPLASTPFNRQQASLTIERVRAAELLRALVEWSRRQPLWTTRGLRLERSASGGESSGKGARDNDDRFTAYLTLENVHLAPSGPGAANPPDPRKGIKTNRAQERAAEAQP